MSHQLLRSVLLIYLLPIVLTSCVLSVSLNAQNVKPGAYPSWSRGSRHAPVIIEVFNDYQCPPCARFNEELKEIEAEHKENVRIIFRNFPLTGIHKNALAAAQAAEAAGMQGKFVEMIDLLYEKQNRWSHAGDVQRRFASYARRLGLDVRRLIRDMKGRKVRKRIQLDVERAESLKVNGTPTILINGREMDVLIPERLRNAIKEAQGQHPR